MVLLRRKNHMMYGTTHLKTCSNVTDNRNSKKTGETFRHRSSHRRIVEAGKVMEWSIMQNTPSNHMNKRNSLQIIPNEWFRTNRRIA